MFSDSNSFEGRPQDKSRFFFEFLPSSPAFSIAGEGVDGEIVSWSEGACRRYGCGAEGVLGKAVACFESEPGFGSVFTLLLEEA
jgi:hypothetical protein